MSTCLDGILPLIFCKPLKAERKILALMFILKMGTRSNFLYLRNLLTVPFFVRSIACPTSWAMSAMIPSETAVKNSGL
jgi:hypothetical protein